VEDVLNRAFILLSNRIQSFYPLCNAFSNCLNDDLLPFVFYCLFEADDFRLDIDLMKRDVSNLLVILYVSDTQ